MNERINQIRDGIQSAEEIGALSVEQSANMTYLVDEISRMDDLMRDYQREAAAGRALADAVRAWDREVGSYSDMLNGLAAFDKAVSDE